MVPLSSTIRFWSINLLADALRNQYLVSFSEPRAIRTNLWLSLVAHRPEPSAMLAPMLSADLTNCFPIVSLAKVSQPFTTLQISSANISAALKTRSSSNRTNGIKPRTSQEILLHPPNTTH
jgi:hypothetical protein